MLHFILAGRELSDPIDLDEAMCRAAYDRPSADLTVLWSYGAEPKYGLKGPWKDLEEDKRQFGRYVCAALAIHHQLRGGGLRTYVQNPVTGAYLRVPRQYWNARVPHGVLEPVPHATGWDDVMAGQPILVASSDVDRWKEVAREAIRGNPLPEPEAKPRKKLRQTKPKPYWWPMLQQEFKLKQNLEAEFIGKGKMPPVFPKAPWFRQKLISRGVPEDKVPPSTVRYHLAALKEEAGR